jgi:iron complex outermembrane receptor protein
MSWDYRGINTSVFVNFANSYKNNFFQPSQKIDAWTTVDLQLGYSFPSSVQSIFRGVSVSATAQNLFDDPPPFVAVPTNLAFDVGYDATNASPLGRVLSISLRKRW